jgi:hypothetical protein
VSTRFLEFAENFYGASLGEVARTAARIRGSYLDRRAFPDVENTALDYGESQRQLMELLRPSDFVGLYREQLQATPPIAPPLAPGELRPVFGRAGQSVLGFQSNFTDPNLSTLDHAAVLRAMYGRFSTAESRELKSALLYAHSCLLIDPFAVRPEIDTDVFRNLDHPFLSNWGHSPFLRAEMHEYQFDIGDRIDGFCDAIQALAVLEDLLIDGTITIVTPPDPHVLYFGDERAITHSIVTNFYFMGISPRHRGGPDEDALAEVLKLRAKEQILGLLAYGEHASVFAGGSLDELAIEMVLSEMIECQSISPIFLSRSSEDRRLTSMAELNLPGVNQLASRDMVAVRRHDLFEAFRADVRVGLRTADTESDLDAARAEFASEMRAASQRLNREVPKRNRLDEAIGGDALGWAIGAVGGWSIDGWRGSILGLGAKAAYEVHRTRPNPGVSALRNHYVALS